jgi:hypothetical protein
MPPEANNEPDAENDAAEEEDGSKEVNIQPSDHGLNGVA